MFVYKAKSLFTIKIFNYSVCLIATPIYCKGFRDKNKIKIKKSDQLVGTFENKKYLLLYKVIQYSSNCAIQSLLLPAFY